MADRATIKTTGAGVVKVRLARLKRTRSISVRIGAEATSGRVWRTKTESWETITRTARDNIIALRQNALKGRKVGFLRPNERKGGNVIAQRAFQLWTAGTTKTLDGLLKDFNKLGEYLIRAYREHLKEGRGPRSAFRPLSEGSQAIKNRETKTGPKYGRAELKPMTRTGQLGRSFVATVDRF